MTDSIPSCPPPVADTEAPKLIMPARACDVHTHVFGPEAHYPYSPRRGYTPEDAPLSAMQRMHDILGIERCVLTQPSVYGTDNRAMMDAVATAPDRYRAIVAVEPDVSDSDLEAWNAAGARGVRFNLVDKGGMPFDSFDQIVDFSERLFDLGWHVEFLLHVDRFPNLAQNLARLHTDVVLGHMGYMKMPKGIATPGFQDFLSLLRDGRCWSKMTGAYRVTERDTPPYDDVVPVARAIMEAAPERVLWGSDWPHPWHYREMPNDGYLLDQLADWTKDQTTIQRILVENPARLYGFA
ncbi:amidohydrolase family protein [Tropicimonas sp. TH_r6]|uniref:amidohydrolase family protein n=1 Tax=Tropicimonas sp. TH_r6 TaxID=3082085 RepID=UPI0029534E66|nr:amidohydrolase family protein [Tropicimonas sp. TH_r6]MDV7143843.1 amidohydrolase family protein [Tropicimonas sp. TH_r6]